MKNIISVYYLWMAVMPVSAQGSFFNQQTTQLKYLQQQIAALQVYIGYARKGYRIAQTGLTAIGEFKKGEFNLHNLFYNSLQSVNPEITQYYKLGDCIRYCSQIMVGCKKSTNSKRLNPSERNYLSTVYGNLSGACLRCLDELVSLVTNNTYNMKDNERLRRIDALYWDLKDQYACLQSFQSATNWLSAQRTHEFDEITYLNKIY